MAENTAAKSFMGLSSIRVSAALDPQSRDALVDDARCLIGAGLASLETWVDANGGNDESIWASIYSLRMGFVAIEAAARSVDSGRDAGVQHG